MRAKLEVLLRLANATRVSSKNNYGCIYLKPIIIELFARAFCSANKDHVMTSLSPSLSRSTQLRRVLDPLFNVVLLRPRERRGEHL